MANGRDDRTAIDFTVADRVMLAEIHSRIKDVMGVKKQVVRNTTWIKVIKWSMGSGGIMVALRIFGLL